MNTFKVVSDSVEKTKKIAKNISSNFSKGDIILLDGGLGTGKTHFVKGFADGYQYSEEVTSPTFNIANFYKVKDFTLIHIDLYRIEDFEEFNDLGLFEYFPEAIVLIEWGKKFEEYFDDHFSISIEHNENETRKLSFSINNNNLASKLDAIHKKIDSIN